MKKIVLFLSALCLLTACDDGDMTFETFNFGNAEPARCTESGILYKTSDNQILILDLDDSALLNQVTSLEEPREITLNGTNKLIYRTYNGDVNGNTIVCNDIPPSTPSVTEEWLAQDGGTIEIITNEVRNSTTNKLTGYTHSINITRATFIKGNEEIRIEDSYYGKIQTTLGYDFTFGNEEDETPIDVNRCDNGLLFTRNTTNALILNFDDSFFSGTDTANPVVINTETDITNTVKLYVYNGTISDNTICVNSPVISPTLTSIWQAVAGTVEIKAVPENLSPTGFSYEIRFYDIRFINSSNDNLEIYPDPNTTLGDYYYFGKYTPLP